jgi:ElaB/YqjD/DUF883 family membrane-anchored ribosome-binding protein
MFGRSGYSRAISADIGEIDRRLRTLERHLQRVGSRTSASAAVATDRIAETVAAALNTLAERFRSRAGAASEDAARLGGEAAKLGKDAVRRLTDTVEERPLIMLGVAVGIGILLGVAGRYRH